MLRKIYLFGSVGLHALAIGPHIYARIIRSPLSTPGFRLRDQSCLSLTGDLNFRGGSNVDANTVSDSSYDDSEVSQDRKLHYKSLAILLTASPFLPSFVHLPINRPFPGMVLTPTRAIHTAIRSNIMAHTVIS
jgi:hypothetical protein